MSNAEPLLDHDLISSRYFFPRRAALPGAWRVAMPDGVELACYHHRPHADALTVLHFHGNGEVVADHLSDLVPALERLGLNTLLVEYRGYGTSTGVPALSQMLDDVDAVINASGIAPDRLIAFGRSVGSLYALHAAHRFPQLAGLIIESGIADVHERIALRVTPEELGCTPAALTEAMTRRFDHEAKLRGYPGPLLILHTKHDHIVHVRHAKALASWSPGCAIELFDAGDHNSIFWYNARAYMEAIERFTRSLPGR